MAFKAPSSDSITLPGSSTDEGLVRWDGGAGNTVQDSGWTLSDADVMTMGGNLETNGHNLTTTTDGLDLTQTQLTSSTTDDYTFSISATLNDSGAAGGSDLYTGFKVNVTETDVTGWDNVNLMDLQVDGSSVFKVTDDSNDLLGTIQMTMSNTTQEGLAIYVNDLTSGKGVQLNSSSASVTNGNILYANISSSGNGLPNRGQQNVYLGSTRQEARTSGTTADDFDNVYIVRSDTTTGAGGTLTAAGSALKVQTTALETAGTLTTTAHAIEVSHSSRNDSADVYAVKITSDNLGTNGPGGIDMSSFSTDEPLMNLPTDTTAEGTYYGRIAVNVEGVGIKYISLYNA